MSIDKKLIILLTLRMAFKSHIENSLASLREATLVATKQSNECGLPRPLRGLAMTSCTFLEFLNCYGVYA